MEALLVLIIREGERGVDIMGETTRPTLQAPSREKDTVGLEPKVDRPTGMAAVVVLEILVGKTVVVVEEMGRLVLRGLEQVGRLPELRI